MNIKKLIKRLLSPIQCIRFGIAKHGENLYIGKACKIVNGKQMDFGNDISIMPYSMLVCHSGGRIIMGDGCEIGMFSRVAAQGCVVFGNNVFSGPHIFIADYNHEYSNPDLPIKNQGNRIRKTDEFERGGGTYWR